MYLFLLIPKTLPQHIKIRLHDFSRMTLSGTNFLRNGKSINLITYYASLPHATKPYVMHRTVKYLTQPNLTIVMWLRVSICNIVYIQYNIVHKQIFR